MKAWNSRAIPLPQLTAVVHCAESEFVHLENSSCADKDKAVKIPGSRFGDVFLLSSHLIRLCLIARIKLFHVLLLGTR